MFTCLFCGLENLSNVAQFCTDCGHESPSKDWLPEEVDQPEKVKQYASMLNELFFDAHAALGIEKITFRARERLKISYQAHSKIVSKLNQQKKAIAHLSNFRFEFNENVTDAYAKHDTFLDFRYTNLSQDELFKVSLLWDDPETVDRVEFRVETKSFVMPLASVTVGGATIFDRIGIKEVSDLQVTITDQFGKKANFRVEPFRFKVGNPEQRSTQNISTHNQISIEGRGVVDASGMGTNNSAARLGANNQLQWKELNFIYLPVLEEDWVIETQCTLQPLTNKKQVEDIPLFSSSIYDGKDLSSLFNAAENGDAVAQNKLGDKYLCGDGVPQDEELAVHWHRNAAEQGFENSIMALRTLGIDGVIGNDSEDEKKFLDTETIRSDTSSSILTYAFPTCETRVGQFQNNEYISDLPKNSVSDSKFNSVDEIIQYYAKKKILGLGKHFYLKNDLKFDKKFKNFYRSFLLKAVYRFNQEEDAPVLFYDGSLLGSGKSGIVFTANSIYFIESSHFCKIAYSQIVSVRMTTDKFQDKKIFIESTAHLDLISLNPIYATREDLLSIVEMLNKIQRFLED